MNRTNTIYLDGNLTHDPIFDTAGDGTKVSKCFFSIIANRENGKVVKIPCVAWDDLADYIMKIATKGTYVYLEGELNSRSLEKDGNSYLSVEVVVKKVSHYRASTGYYKQAKEDL